MEIDIKIYIKALFTCVIHMHRASISTRVLESNLTKTRTKLICKNPVRLYLLSHKLNGGEFKDSQTPPRRIHMNSRSSLRNSTPDA